MACLDPDDRSDRDLRRISLLGQVHAMAGGHKRTVAARFLAPCPVLFRIARFLLQARVD